MEKQLILVVDDDEIPTDSYLEALRKKGFAVHQCFNPDDALAFVQKEKDNIAALILDVRMTPGKAYQNSDTANGTKTGIVMYKDMRRHLDKKPIIIITLAALAPRETIEMNPYTMFALKMDYPPHALAQLVCDMINRAHEQSKMEI